MAGDPSGSPLHGSILTLRPNNLFRGALLRVVNRLDLTDLSGKNLGSDMDFVLGLFSPRVRTARSMTCTIRAMNQRTWREGCKLAGTRYAELERLVRLEYH